jgi:hypothetical protein
VPAGIAGGNVLGRNGGQAVEAGQTHGERSARPRRAVRS